MLSRSFYAAVAVSLFVVGARATEAQLPSLVRFNVNAGAAMRVSDARDDWNTGFRVGAGLELRAPLLPLGLRVDGAYDRMGIKGSGANLSIWSATANAVFSLPPGLLYGIGGIGFYSSDPGGGSSTDFGFNIGAGLSLPLPLLSPFIEARFHQINGDGGDFRYVPVVVGIRL